MDMQAVEEFGYAVVKGVIPRDVCARARAFMDAELGPPAERVHAHVAQRYGLNEVEDTGDKWGKWPGPLGIARYDGEGLRPPEIASGGYRHSLRHPIRHPVCAELVPPAMVRMHERLLRTENLRMNQQFMIRTDHSPPPYPETPGWHMDHSFLPMQYDATPRAVYYSSMVVLSKIDAGGAAFTVSPPSLREGKAEAARIFAEEPDWCAQLSDDGYRIDLSARIAPTLSDNGNGSPGHEILADEGDVVIINPMCLHAASPMRLPGRSRHVCFNTFFSQGGEFMLLPERGATRPAAKFSPELRQGLEANGLLSLLDWEPPTTPDSQSRRFFGDARL